MLIRSAIAIAAFLGSAGAVQAQLPTPIEPLPPLEPLPAPEPLAQAPGQHGAMAPAAMGERMAAEANIPHASQDPARTAPYTAPHAPGVVLGYSLDQRNAWLADCRIIMLGGATTPPSRVAFGHDHEGALVGGLVGAVTGGVSGNRIADGDRLAGTLIGAGLGGLAGAVLGGLIDRHAAARETRALEQALEDAWAREQAWADNYCQAYLRRYEAAGIAQASHHHQDQIRPGLIVERRIITRTVHDDAESMPSPPPQQPRRLAQPDKRLRLN